MTPSPRLTLAVAAGGAAGALLRHAVDMADVADVADLGTAASGGFPWPTLAVNVVGSFLLALLPAAAVVRRSPGWAAALGPGLLGGFTTLSAYAEDARRLLVDDRLAHAAVGAYVIKPNLICPA